MAILLSSIDDLHNERLRRLYRYWQEKRGSRGMPRRSDIDPLDLSFCLGYLCLVEIEDDHSLRFRFRVDGSHCVEISGIEMTGRYVDEIPQSEYRTITENAYRQIFLTKAPHFYLDDEIWDNRRYRIEGLLLPLSDDGKTVNMLIDVMLPRPLS
ncbi:MAG TPA: PAS domain-containing protein [Terriglobia bacterium]|nr:PAS domain-containing protein [Terriglobia bacterium]